MKRKRLKLLKKAIQEQAEKDFSFYMGSWGKITGDVSGLEECKDEVKRIMSRYMGEGECHIVDPVKGVECCTAACALGTAALYPPLFDKGLRLVSVGSSTLRDTIYFKGEVEYAAGAKFFGITDEESDYLFSPAAYRHVYAGYIKPQEVIDRIDYLLEGGEV